MMDTLFVITLYTSFFSILICFITMIISILTFGKRFDKQFKHVHVPGDIGIPFFIHIKRCGLYTRAIITNRNTHRYREKYKKGVLYKYYGNFDFRAHCSSFEICHAYIHCYIAGILAFSGILNFTIEYFT